MKQKAILSQPATKEDLSKLDSKFEKNINALEKRLRLERRLTVEESTRHILEEMTKFKDLILTTVDPLLRELEDRKEDRELSTKQMYQMKEQVEGHEERLQKLEKLQAAA